MAKKWVQKMGFRSYMQFRNYAKRYYLPNFIPQTPQDAYRNEYEGDTLFFGYKPPIILPYQQSQQLVQKLKIKTLIEYRAYVKKHEVHKICMRLPTHPYKCPSWKPFWTCWGDFLGTGSLSPKQRSQLILPFEEAKAFVHQLHLKNHNEWLEYAKSGNRPNFIPRLPERKYPQYNYKEWLGIGGFYSLDTRMKQFGVWVITHDKHDQLNVLNLELFKAGKAQAKLQCKTLNKTIMRMYTYEHDLQQEVSSILDRNCSSVDGNTFVTNNFQQLRYELDMTLLIIKY